MGRQPRNRRPNLSALLRGSAADIRLPGLTARDIRRIGGTLPLGDLQDLRDRNLGNLLDLQQQALPLALLPMSLEYRFVEVNQPLVVKESAALRDRLKPFIGRRPPKSKVERHELAAQKRAIVDEHRLQKDRFKTLNPTTSRQLWMRWYPDESFAEDGVPPVTPDEAAARDMFVSAIAGRDWWDMSDTQVATHWQQFAQSVGGYRAVHLMRDDADTESAEYQARIGRIAALPGKVALYGAFGGEIRKLAEGGKIPANTKSRPSLVSYTPEAAEPGGWLVDFEAAIDHGMGIKITDEATIKEAEAADWIIAVGLSPAAGAADIAALLQSHIAQGEFAVLPQDSATNNTPDALSYLQRPEHDLENFTARATALERGEYEAQDTSAADLLAEALDIPPDALRRAVDGADTGFEDAKAMLRVIGPALLDEALDGISPVADVSEDQFIEIMAAAITARGVLPAVRVGDNAMGVLPMTRLDDYRLRKADAETPTGKIHDFLRQYALNAGDSLADFADVSVPVIEPGDPESSDKLFDILTRTRVSKRLDVSGVDADVDKIRGLGCPYVSGPAGDKKPQTYLEALRTQHLSDLPDPDAKNRQWPLLYRLARLSVVRNTTYLAAPGVLGKTGDGGRPQSSQPPASALDGADLSLSGLRLSGSDFEKVSLVFAEMSVTSLAALKPGSLALANLDRDLVARLTRINLGFAQALAHLQKVAARPGGIAQLEILLCEVIDLFQHRVDAFATGLAYARLRSDRQAGQQGLLAGYYGFLGKLRPQSVTGASDGYIQAPSVPQAMTSALLRSAYLRHRAGGAFEIRLSSRRTRRALRLLDLIAKGHDLQQALGLRGERWLHDAGADPSILHLRARFPITSESTQSIAVRRVFNGLAFIESAVAEPQLQALQKQLSDDLNALSDIVMAEAVHRRALGQSDAANAWLQVLSGHPPPGPPVFLRTQRHGQGSSYRVSVLLPEVAPQPAQTVREIAEPGLASYARQVLQGFGDATLVVSLRLADDTASSTSSTGASTVLTFSLQRDLGMSPLDLVVGGGSEVQVRARARIARHLGQNPQLLGQMGQALQGQALSFSVDLSAGPAPLEPLMQKAELLRQAVKNGRPLEASDLNAAANTKAGDLSETAAIRAIQYGINSLRARLTQLQSRLNADLAALRPSLSGFQTETREAQRCIDAGEPQAMIEQCLLRADQQQQRLTEMLAALAPYGEPDALRFFTTAEAMNDPEALFGRLRALVARLDARQANLLRALRDHPDSGQSALADARADLQGCIAALQVALDGEAMTILPPVPRNDPALQPAIHGASDAKVNLAPWDQHRTNVLRARDLAAFSDEMVSFAVGEQATVDPDDPDPDPRPGAESPDVRHRGFFLARRSDFERPAAAVCGFVCDEWAVQRPSQTQLSGVAVNYDSPQAEAPHCILLGVAPNTDFKSWTPQRTAELVWETIRWMKARALSSYDRIAPGAIFTGANVLAPKQAGDTLTRRIPQASKFAKFADQRVSGFALTTVDTTAELKQAGTLSSQLAERIGFGYVKE